MINVEFIQINDTLTPELNRLVHALENTRPLMAEVGREMALDIQQHFRDQGGASFWAGVANATAMSAFDSHSVTVSVSPPEGFHALHRIHGGTVKAKPPRKFLAIPANDYAKRAGWPSSWSKVGDGKLKVLWGKNGPYALALNQDRIRWKRSGKKSLVKKDDKVGNWGKGVIMYWLKRQVTHKASPEAAPSRALLINAVERAARRYLNRILKNRPQS